MIDAILYIASIAGVQAHLEATTPQQAAAPQQASASLFWFDTTPVIRQGDAGLVYVRASADDLAAVMGPGVTVLAQADYAGAGTADAVYGALFADPVAAGLYDAVWSRAPQLVDDGEGGTALWTPPERFGEMA